MYGWVRDELTIEEIRRFGVISIADCGRFEDIKQHLTSQYYVRAQCLFIFPVKKYRRREIEKRRIMKLNENKDNLESFWNNKTRNMPEHIRATFLKKVRLIIRNSEMVDLK